MMDSSSVVLKGVTVKTLMALLETMPSDTFVFPANMRLVYEVPNLPERGAVGRQRGWVRFEVPYGTAGLAEAVEAGA